MSLRSRPNWTRFNGPMGDSNGARWKHDASGALVIHCGHATALWPYYGQLADGTNPTIKAERDSSRVRPRVRKGDPFVPKFRHLSDCQQFMEEQAAP